MTSHHPAIVNCSYINDEHLKQVSDGANIYGLASDVLGRCVKRTLTGGATTYYIYDGERPMLEYDAAGALAARNVYGKGVDELLMRTDYTFNPTAVFYYQHDHAGSATHLTNGSGDVIERYRYDVFGAPTIYPPQPGATPIPASAVSNRFLFTGREYAAAFGFYEYRARAYHPGLGRFTSEDPKLFDAGDYNLYRYCHNDPLDMTDPMGLEEVEIVLRAFIQQANVGVGRFSYRGDNRGFSTAASASSRVSVSVKIETDPAKNKGNPLIPPINYTIQSTHNNLTGRDSISSGPQLPKVEASQDKNGNVAVNIQMHMKNPEQPDALKGIRSNVNVSVDQSARKGSVDGSISGAPSWEAIVTRQGGPSKDVKLQEAAPNPAQFVRDLQRTNEVHKPFCLPPLLKP